MISIKNKTQPLCNTVVRQKKKGFTLVEMMVSIFVFLIIMVAIVDVFAQHVQAYKYARTVQGDLENAQFALNYISKTLRTASLIGEGSTSGGMILIDQSAPDYENDFYFSVIDSAKGLIVYDFSQEACVIFTFRESHDDYAYPALWMETLSDVGINETEECLNETRWTYNSDYKDQRLTTGSVTGSFAVAPTRYMDNPGSRDTDTIGRATIGMRVESSEYVEDDSVNPVYIQSSVSMRDYPSDLSF